MNVVMDGREEIRGISESAREIRVPVSAASALVKSIVKLWVVDVEF
jgi:hypothetical protein